MRWTKSCGGGIALLCAIAACSSGDGATDPGRITLHRLNNAEYNNTVHDLLGTTLSPAKDFAADDRAYGFDNVADVLKLSPLSLELYESAASALITDALAVQTVATSQQFEITTDASKGQKSGDGWLIFTTGEGTITVPTSLAGAYEIEVRAYEQHAGDEPAKMSITVAGQPPVIIDVTAIQASPELYKTTVMLPANSATISVGFTNDCCSSGGDRNLWIDYVKVTGPNDAPAIGDENRKRILTCDQLADAACQTQILAGFAKRAWRRPTTTAEIDKLRALIDKAIADGDTAENGLRLALQAVLISPHFVFRVELDPGPGVVHPLTDYELASRLSYFLWSSMPDAELFALADAGTLSKPETLAAQVRRMLDDARSDAFVDNFAGQWLYTRALSDHPPDPAVFPDYDKDLEDAMRAETRAYFRAFLDDGVPFTEFLTADFTYVNDRLAAFYGMPLPGTTEVTKVSLADTNRRGFLMQGSFLRLTSRPKRTSPVLRGKWILDNLLCTPPRPPPPNVGSIPEMEATGSIRTRLEAHQQDPVCASCHSTMDPLGFGLDGFDAIGAYRTEDQGYPIDTTGVLFDEIPFEDGIEMATILAKEPTVYRCFVEKLYTYTGRSPSRIEAYEHIDRLTSRFADSGYQLRDLIVALVTDPSFVSRRGER